MLTRLEIRLFDMVMCLTEALDLVSPVVTGHHKRVAYIASEIAEEMNLSSEEQNDILIAAALHDVGAFSFNQQFKDLFFEEENVTNIHKHAYLGARLLNKFPPFKEIVKLVKFHHTSWQDTRQKEIPLGSYILHLADRIEVKVKEDKILDQADWIQKEVESKKGKKFAPEAVDAFLNKSKKEAFWFNITNPKLEQILEKKAAKTKIKLNPELLLRLAEIFGHIIDFQSSFTATHSSGVAATAEILADLINLSQDEIIMIKIAGYLHDLGKLVVPNEILNKPSKLTTGEYNIIKQHPFYTYQILDGINGLEEVKNWASFHHERLDGTGYPFKLIKKELSVPARIMAVADVFTAITEDRPYREGMDKDKSLKILKEMVDDFKLDGEIVAVLSANFKEVDQLRRFSQDMEQRQYEKFSKQVG